MTQKIKGKEYTERKIMNAFDRFYKIASDENIIEGEEWYAEANKVCGGLARKFNYPVCVVAGVMAVMSAQTSWTVNQMFTKQFLETGGKKTIANLQKTFKCKRILKVTTPEEVAALISIKPDGGPKTKAFYWSILDHKNSTIPCIDRHIIAAATQHPNNVHAMAESGGGITDKQYHFLANCLTKLAEEKGEPVNKVQARIWVSYREQRNLFTNKTHTEWWEEERLEEAPF